MKLFKKYKTGVRFLFYVLKSLRTYTNAYSISPETIPINNKKIPSAHLRRDWKFSVHSSYLLGIGTVFIKIESAAEVSQGLVPPPLLIRNQLFTL